MAKLNACLVVVIVLPLVTACAALSRVPAGSVGVVSHHDGHPRALRAEQFLTLGERSGLSSQDVLLTGQDDRVRIRFSGGVDVALGVETQLGIHAADESGQRFSLAYGTIEVGKSRRASPVEIVTSWGAINLRRGRVLLTSDDAGQVLAILLERGEAGIVTYGGELLLEGRHAAALLRPAERAQPVKDLTPQFITELESLTRFRRSR